MQPKQILLTQIANFRPLSGPSPLYPPVVVNGVQISGFGSGLEALHLHENLEKVLKEIYPTLSIPELARLTSLLPEVSVEAVLLVYGYRNNEILQKVFEFILKLPDSVQDYLSEKDFSLGDLRTIIPAVDHFEMSLSFLKHCVSLPLSKSQTVEACELANELLAMGEFSWDPKLDREKLVESLRKQRYPLASQKDQLRTQNVKNQKWPHRSQVRWTRQGDLSGLEIKFFVTNPAEYSRAISEISKISPEDVWK